MILKNENVLKYIRENWKRSVYRDDPGQGFGGVDLPYRYTSPSIKGEGHFCFFFYWDTYFTNIGLLNHGLHDIAKDNILNILWLIKRQGYMPNHVGLYNRSQPPYLCRMVKEYLAATGDEAFLAECAEGLRQEYNFWVTARTTPTGLSQFRHHDTADSLVDFYEEALVSRLSLPAEAAIEEKQRLGSHYMGIAEAGCDFTNRFENRSYDYVPVELNALLYEYEVFLAECSKKLHWGDDTLWEKRAGIRKERMNKYLWNEEKGLFLDYDFVNKKHSDVPALSGIQTMANGIASKVQAARMVDNLPLFEREHGIAYTADVPGCRDYQWAFPVVWPPAVYMVVEGLRTYGYDADAKRIAQKYVNVAEKLFEETGQLWEKSDAVTGEVYNGEYMAAPMMGWSAGVFVDFCNYLK